MSWASTAFHSAGWFIRTLSACYVFNKYGMFLSRVSGPSMFPTFTGRDDIVLVEAVSPVLDRIAKGDVVICVRPVDPGEHIIKRVAALGGEEVLVYPSAEDPNIRRVQVPRGHVWLQGDNLLHSLDSRVYGPVPLALVRGRVLCQVWPNIKRISSEWTSPVVGPYDT